MYTVYCLPINHSKIHFTAKKRAEMHYLRSAMASEEPDAAAVGSRRVPTPGSSEGDGRAKEGAGKGDLLKQVSPVREALGLMDLIVFIKVSAVSLNQSSTSIKAEEHPGRHPNRHLPFQAPNPHRSLRHRLQPFHSARYSPQVTATKHAEHPAAADFKVTDAFYKDQGITRARNAMFASAQIKTLISLCLQTISESIRLFKN